MNGCCSSGGSELPVQNCDCTSMDRNTMNPNARYVTLKGTVLDLSGLDADEVRLVERLQRQAEALADWNAFDNYRFAELVPFYDARGVPRRDVLKTVPYLIG